MRLIISLLMGCLLLQHPARAQKAVFDRIIASSAKALRCPPPDARTPVTVNAVLVKDASSASSVEMAVIVKASILSGWHLYAFVPSNLPYITTDCLLELPAGLTAVGEWQKSPATPSSTDAGVLTWENEAVFVRRVRAASSGKGQSTAGQQKTGQLKAGLSYQTCDLRQCLPPAEKWFQLTF